MKHSLAGTLPIKICVCARAQPLPGLSNYPTATAGMINTGSMTSRDTVSLTHTHTSAYIHNYNHLDIQHAAQAAGGHKMYKHKWQYKTYSRLDPPTCIPSPQIPTQCSNVCCSLLNSFCLRSHTHRVRQSEVGATNRLSGHCFIRSGSRVNGLYSQRERWLGCWMQLHHTHTHIF